MKDTNFTAFITSKKRYVVESLGKKVGLSIDSSTSSSTCNYGALSEDTKLVVHTFCSSNDITWQTPGDKDRIIIREINTEGAKVKRTEQVGYMLKSLSRCDTC